MKTLKKSINGKTKEKSLDFKTLNIGKILSTVSFIAPHFCAKKQLAQSPYKTRENQRKNNKIPLKFEKKIIILYSFDENTPFPIFFVRWFMYYYV